MEPKVCQAFFTQIMLIFFTTQCLSFTLTQLQVLVAPSTSSARSRRGFGACEKGEVQSSRQAWYSCATFKILLHHQTAVDGRNPSPRPWEVKKTCSKQWDDKVINYQTQLVSQISRISEPSTAVTWHTAYCFLSRCDFLHITVSPVTSTWHRLKQQPPTRHRVRKEAVECLNSCGNETWNLQRHAWVVLSLDAFNIHPEN